MANHIPAFVADKHINAFFDFVRNDDGFNAWLAESEDYDCCFDCEVVDAYADTLSVAEMDELVTQFFKELA